MVWEPGLPARPGGIRLWLAETRPSVTAEASRTEGRPASEGIWSHRGLGLWGLVAVVVGLEEPLVAAQLHGVVGV